MNGRDRVEVIMLRRKRAGSTPMEFSEDDFGDDNGSQVNLNSVGNVLVQRNAANARERARMRVLSSAFGCLKTKLPNIPPDTKLSKLDTLRLATIYIKQLKTIVDADDNFTSNVHMYDYNNTLRDGCINLHKETTTNMNWPFGFYHHHYQHHHHHQQQQQQQQQQHQYNQNNISINSLPTWPNGHSCSVLQNLKHNSILTTPNECIGDFVNKNSLTHLSENYKNDQNSWYMMESADSTKQLTSKYPNISNHHIHHLDQHHHNHHKQNNATLQIWCNQRNHQGQQEQQEHHLPHYSIQEVNNRINIYPQRHQ